MLFKPIFRDRALAHRAKQEPLDDRLQITAPHEWLLLAALGVTFLVLLLFAAFGQLERGLSFEAVLIHPGERHAVLAPVSGTVTEVLVAVGDLVEPEQPLARVRTPSAQFRESLMLRLGDSLLQAERGSESEPAAAALLRALLREPNGVAAASRDELSSPHGGEVMSLDLTPGQALLAGQEVAVVRAARGGLPMALALVSPGEAALLEVGMEAYVRLPEQGAPGGNGLRARVESVSRRPLALPEWLSALGLPVPERAHLLRVRLVGDQPEPPPADGTSASLRVVLGRSSFMALLMPGRRD